jgi:hypothetical protein
MASVNDEMIDNGNEKDVLTDRPGALPVPKRPRVTNVLICGSGPCRTARIVDGESKRVTEEPLAVEKDPGKP